MITDNNVIQQGNAEHFARPPDLPCHGNVVTAWFRDSAWMVVNQQNMNRTELQCRKKKLPRRNHRRIDRSSCDFLFSEKLIFCVQHHAEKNLLILVAETFHVIIRNGSRIMKAETFLDVSGWGMGEVWINGQYLGAYWEENAEKTLEIPAGALIAGNNEIVVFELKNNEQASITLTDKPIFK